MKAWRRAHVALVLTSCLGALASLRAQGPTGAITGRVLLDRGTPMPGAILITADLDTGKSLSSVSVSDGTFSFPRTPPTTYYLAVSFYGFRPMAVRDVVVTPGKPTDVGDVTMTVARRALESDPPVASAESTTDSSSIASQCSAVVDSLCGRFIVEQGRIDLALENRSSEPIVLVWSTEIDLVMLRVHDQSGAPMANVELGGPPLHSGQTNWLTISPQSTSRQRVTAFSVETERDGPWVVFTGNHFWRKATSGDTYVRGRLMALAPPRQDGHVWSGELELPPVALPLSRW